MGETMKVQEYLSGRAMKVLLLLWQSLKNAGAEDPRRAVHALKVGVSLALVSFLYLLEPLFEGIGENAMWAVITVVVVLEFTAGATLCKGLNRGLGTLLAGSLAFFIAFLSDKSGRVFRGVFVGVSVFLIGFTATYMRFIPYIKKNFDYGVLIFILTFNLITVPGYPMSGVLRIARERLYTIAIGCSLCLLMSLFVFPNWSGQDLHNSTVSKLESLSKSIEASVNAYFQDTEGDNANREDFYRGYKEVLDSKSSDESLAQFASWEPRYSRHCYRCPWQQYVKLGAVLRHFGYAAVSLHGCLESEIQTPQSLRRLFRDPCIRVAKEVTKSLSELANSIKNHRHCSPDVLTDNLHAALQDLNSAIKSQPRLFLGPNHGPRRSANQKHYDSPRAKVSLPTVKTDNSALRNWKAKINPRENNSSEQRMLRPTLSQIVITTLEFSDALPFAAFASLLVEMAVRLEFVIEEVEELARAANFREFIVEKDESGEVGSRNGRRGAAETRIIHVVSQGAE